MGREERGQRKKEGTKGGGDSFRGREGFREENYSIQEFPPSFLQLQDGRRGVEENGRKRT